MRTGRNRGIGRLGLIVGLGIIIGVGWTVEDTMIDLVLQHDAQQDPPDKNEGNGEADRLDLAESQPDDDELDTEDDHDGSEYQDVEPQEIGEFVEYFLIFVHQGSSRR